MGGTITAVSEQSDGKVNKETRGASGTSGTESGKGQSAENPRTSGTSGTSGASGTEKGILPAEGSELSLLSDEERKLYATANETERKKILKNAKRRQKYAEQKKANGQSVKPRKVNTTKKDSTPALDVTQLNLIVAGISSAVASRPNCEHWLLTEAEINSITVPLSKMIAESETFSSMGQYSNQIALVMACLTVFGPRLFITVQQSKEAKKIERTGQHTDTNYRERKSGSVGKTKDNNRKSDNGAHSNAPSNNSNNDKDLFLYGAPIV